MVEDACIGYLQQLKLPAEQLSHMMQLWDKLMLYEARKETLQLHAHRVWTGNVLETLPVLFEELVHAGPQEVELCKEVLFSSECGALCELQVCSPSFHLEVIGKPCLLANPIMFCLAISCRTQVCVSSSTVACPKAIIAKLCHLFAVIDCQTACNGIVLQ